MTLLLPNKTTYTPYAILNFTPDSFSDGGIFFDPVLAYRRVSYLKKIGVDYIDLGAQSTAPYNCDIGEDEELNRVKALLNPKFLSLLEGFYVSIDSFRPNVVFYVWDLIKRYNPRGFVWNDVSGVVDIHVKNFLRLSDSCRYVLSHNNCGQREYCCNHMDYVTNLAGEQFIESVISSFEYKLSSFPEIVHKKIILDVCFGFSKTASQNYLLLKKHKEIERCFPTINSWIVGVSRKSFLKKVVNDQLLPEEIGTNQLNSILSSLETYCVNKFFRGSCNYYIRTHVPENFVIFDSIDIITDS